jgi:hypothetical protein
MYRLGNAVVGYRLSSQVHLPVELVELPTHVELSSVEHEDSAFILVMRLRVL